jgi:hypothetical protein
MMRGETEKERERHGDTVRGGETERSLERQKLKKY